MKIIVESEINIDASKYVDKLHSDALGKFAAVTWHKLYSPYVPFDTGKLQNTVQIDAWQITHVVPYARYVYNGHFNFRKHMHPLATREWDKAAEPSKKPDLENAMQAYIDRGGLNLDQ